MPIVVRVANHAPSGAPDEEPVVSEQWLSSQLENANRLFNPHGVSFRRTARQSMEARYARMETRRDRHSLGALMQPHVINWFVVLSLRDVDDRSRYRQGVHWRPRGRRYPDGLHFVITSSIAGPHVLAHELGHFFGNPHSDVAGNIMSYERGEGPPFFDAEQARRIRRFGRRFIESGEIVPLR